MKHLFRCLLIALILSIQASAFTSASQRGLSVELNSAAAGSWGDYHALIIGINDYHKWPRLQTAVKDATVIRDTLVSRYGFPAKNVILRTDKAASRLQITRDLRYLAQSMRPDDNLLVYYAGHGQLDDLTGDGYWVPSEGAMKDPATWVANSYIKAILSSEKVQAKNVVVIADSCYSGSMLRGGPSLMSMDDQRYQEKLAEKASLRSRQVISSGGVEPVADGGAEGHSLFAFYLIDALRKNDREVIDLENLFHTKVWKPVTEIGDQRPNVGRLKTPMDQNGQFVLYNAAWAREQQARRAVAEAEQQKQVQTEQKAAVASAELELQRQRIEMEKQRLAQEKEQMARERALEKQQRDLEKQRQEFEYAKLQAQLEEMKRQNQKTPPNTLAAVSPAIVDNGNFSGRLVSRGRYRLALLPIKALQTGNYGVKMEAEVIKGIAAAVDADEKLELAYAYKKSDEWPDDTKLLSDVASSEDIRAWYKKSFLSKNEPDWKKVRNLGPKIDAQIAILINGSSAGGRTDFDIYCYDFSNDKIYSELGVTGDGWGAANDVQKVVRKLLRDFHKDQK